MSDFPHTLSPTPQIIDRLGSREHGWYTGYYTDKTNGDLWELSEYGWRWINGGRFRFIPYDNLEWNGRPNPFS